MSLRREKKGAHDDAWGHKVRSIEGVGEKASVWVTQERMVTCLRQIIGDSRIAAIGVRVQNHAIFDTMITCVGSVITNLICISYAASWMLNVAFND